MASRGIGRHAILLANMAVVMGLEGMCLEDGILEEKRKLFVNGEESYPLGIWVNGWPAGHLTAVVMQILIGEMLGLHVNITGYGANTIDGFYAMAGCGTPKMIGDRGCGPKITKSHVCVEGWTESYLLEWNYLQQEFADTAPINVDNMGYFGKTSMYVPKRAVDKGWEAEGVALEFFKGYNVSWHQPHKYFSPISSVNTSRLMPCNETRLMTNEGMQNYVNYTGDWDGVEVAADGTVKGKCFDGYFWYPPACRDNSSKCIVFFTGGNGWNIEETMQKSTTWNIPIAPAVAKSWSEYVKLPLTHDSSFYWWVPDPTFLLLKPLEVTFPPFDREAHKRGDKATAPEALSVDKYVSQDLAALSPGADALVRSYLIDLETVNSMLSDQLETGDDDWTVVCRWLRNSREVWKDWLPDPTKCNAQFGLYNEETQQYVANREDPSNLICKACPSGTYSTQLQDGKGRTFTCVPCPIGQSQSSGASVQCQLCLGGEYQDEVQSTSCKRCGIGLYQDAFGQSGCKKCPAGTSTYGFGSKLASECVCTAGSIDLAQKVTSGEDLAAQCVPCGIGLHCPKGSSLQTLKSGSSPNGEEFIPSLLSGYFSDMQNPMEVFKCKTHSHCPGGLPGQCGGLRKGIACGECPSGMWMNQKSCTLCSSWSVALWITGSVVALMCLVVAYYVMNPEITAKATAKQSTAVAFGMAVAMLQLLAIVSLMTNSKYWTGAMNTALTQSRVLLIDLDALAFTCVAGIGGGGVLMQYVINVLIFPAAILWFVLLLFLSRLNIRPLATCLDCLPCKALARFRGSWTLPKTLNTMGHFMVICFSPMCVLAFDPLMCYSHPNGLSSLLKHPQILRGEIGQTMMLATGLAFLGFVGIFLALCSWAVYQLPRWSTSPNHISKVRSCAFLFSRFTMKTWWYGVPLLLRGPCFTMSIVLATDNPSLHRIIACIVLGFFCLLQALTWPWKVPLLNLTDLWLSSTVFMIVVLAPSDSSGSGDFIELCGIGLLASFFMALGTMMLLVAYAFSQEKILGKSGMHSAILNMRRADNHSEICQNIKQVARTMLTVDEEYAIAKMERLNAQDVANIVSCIDLLSLEFLASSESSPIRSTQRFASVTGVKSSANRVCMRWIDDEQIHLRNSQATDISIKDGQEDDSCQTSTQDEVSASGILAMDLQVPSEKVVEYVEENDEFKESKMVSMAF